MVRPVSGSSGWGIQHAPRDSPEFQGPDTTPRSIPALRTHQVHQRHSIEVRRFEGWGFAGVSQKLNFR